VWVLPPERRAAGMFNPAAHLSITPQSHSAVLLAALCILQYSDAFNNTRATTGNSSTKMINFSGRDKVENQATIALTEQLANLNAGSLVRRG
jgi:hypothetical protein